MELKKANDTYDVYQAKLSYLEMIAIADALRNGGDGPVADELRRSFEWHIDKVPGPGEDKKDLEAKKEVSVESPEGGIDAEISAEVDELLPDVDPDSPDYGTEDTGADVDVDVDLDKPEPAPGV